MNAIGRDATAAASEQPWDAVIVGAGPAGSLAAHQLASRGLRTLLVERSAFPRDKVCGGCVGARAVEQLELLGLGHVARGQGGIPIAGLQICRGSRRLAVPLSGGVAISRRAFDAALVDAAIAAGAEFRPETMATVTPAVAHPAASFRQVALRTRDRDAAEIAARVVLAADGLGHSSLRQLPAFESRVAEHARIGLGTVAAASTKDYEPGTIYMAVGRTGYVGVVRVEHDRLNVAAAIDSRFLRQCGRPAAAIATILQQAERPVPAVDSSAWQGTPHGKTGRLASVRFGRRRRLCRTVHRRRHRVGVDRCGRGRAAGRTSLHGVGAASCDALASALRSPDPATPASVPHADRLTEASLGRFDRLGWLVHAAPPGPAIGPSPGAILMTLKLCGIGTAVPERSIDQKDAVEKAMAIYPLKSEQQRLVTALYRRSGVRCRHSVVLTQPTDGDTASQDFYPPARDEHDRGPTTATRMQRYEADAAELACRAASAALHQAGVPLDAVTHLVSVSCSGFSAPGFDIELITRLPLPPGTSRTHVGFMGCHGAMNALRVAKAFAEADRRACVLVCALELCSLHHQYGWEDPETIVANALFADGAAAAVCRQADTSPGDGPWNLVDQASIVIDKTSDLMSWRIGDHGFAMTLSPRVPDVIRRHLRPWLAAWLRQHGLAVEDIGSWAVHPGGPRILQACAESLPLAPPQLAVSRDVLSAFGNMSSPTVLFILERLQSQQASRPCVMLGFGPGLAIEAALLT